ncbi:unnamed protein product [Spirodela intermedia]|uniref:SHSP domain-containing protein n=1 Tax=Spirodela intermedia TaxID=51605 RepID=A0A7I8JRD9_SPIIN|nr:unnamed protein product [Spirodela intermedia]CAA6672341.1 unnamed protein product [Spirodela intermedia]
MPVIQSLFGRSGREDVACLSSPSAWSMLDGFSIGSSLFSPRRGSEETAENHILKADLRGLSEEEVKLKVEAEEGILQVWGEHRTVLTGKDRRWGDAENSVRRFRRRIPLPDDAEEDLMHATVRKGVLIITIPRREVQRPPVKEGDDEARRQSESVLYNEALRQI